MGYTQILTGTPTKYTLISADTLTEPTLKLETQENNGNASLKLSGASTLPTLREFCFVADKGNRFTIKEGSDPVIGNPLISMEPSTGNLKLEYPASLITTANSLLDIRNEISGTLVFRITGASSQDNYFLVYDGGDLLSPISGATVRGNNFDFFLSGFLRLYELVSAPIPTDGASIFFKNDSRPYIQCPDIPENKIMYAIGTGSLGVAPLKQSTTTLENVVSVWQPETDRIGSTTIPDLVLNSHPLTLGTPLQMIKVVHERDYGLEFVVWLYQNSISIGGTASLLTQVRDFSSYWMFKVLVSPYGIGSTKRSIISISAVPNLLDSTENTLFEISVDEKCRLSVQWESGTKTLSGLDNICHLIPDKFHMISAQLQRDATTTLHLWLDGVKVITSTGLTNSSDGSVCNGYFLTNGSGDVAYGILLTDIIFGSGDYILTDDDAIASHNRTTPQLKSKG